MILIDNPKNGYSHMVASSIKELHEFAALIGISKSWFENKKGKNQPHYDVRQWQVNIAVAYGARLVSSKQIVIFLKENYNPQICLLLSN